MTRFFHPIVKAMRGSLGIYLQTLVLLVFAVVVVVAGGEAKKDDCEVSSDTSQQIFMRLRESEILLQNPASGASLFPISSARETNAPVEDYYLWDVNYWIWSNYFPMTTDLCQQWANLAEQGKIFVPMRFPVSPPTLASTEPYTMPVVTTGPNAPVLRLMGIEATPVLTVPLAVKPERAAFLEQELPAAPGELWLALGAVTASPITCPPNLNIPSGRWHLGATIYLDFGGALDTFADRELTLYHCYEGQSPPPGLLAQAVGSQSIAYQGWGITCLGPRPLRLVGEAERTRPFYLYGSHSASITPTQTISFSHSAVNWGEVPVTLTLTTSSTMGLPWGIYADAAGQVPITGPIRLNPAWPGQVQLFWVIANVPPDTPSGTETLIITARDVIAPARSVWTSDLMWVGKWVPPPARATETATPTVTPTRTPTVTPTRTPTRWAYMPLVLRR